MLKLHVLRYLIRLKRSYLTAQYSNSRILHAVNTHAHPYNCVHEFLANVLMFTFAICRRKSVCLSSVCNVRAPYSAGLNFRYTLVIYWHPGKISQRSSQGNPPSGKKD